MRKKRVPPPPKPDNWDKMGWRERNAWKYTYLWNGRRKKRLREKLSQTMMWKLRSLKSFKNKRWDEEDVLDWLRKMTDKRIMGFSIGAVEKLNQCINDMGELKEIKVGQAVYDLRKSINREMEKIRVACVKAVKEIVTNKDLVNPGGESLKMDSKKGYKRIATNIFERDGVRYINISTLLPLDDYQKMKAILELDGLKFAPWLRKRMRKYVSMKFRRLGEIKGLIDKDIDKEIPDEEMEGGEPDANIETKSKIQEKEVASDKAQSLTQEDKGEG